MTKVVAGGVEGRVAPEEAGRETVAEALRTGVL
jgi:hypothetical protein